MGSNVIYSYPEHIPRALEAGRGADDIIDGFAGFIAANTAEFDSVYAVRGIRVAQPMTLRNDLILVPPEHAPPSNYTAEMFVEGMTRRASATVSGSVGGHGVPGFVFNAQHGLAVSALIVKHQLSPIAAPTSDIFDSRAQYLAEQDAVQDFRRAAILACAHNVTLLVSYSVCTDPDYPTKMQAVHTHLPDGPVPPTESAPVDDALRRFNQLSAMPQKDLASLRVAIDRLANAREPRSFVDMALDLGIAMEVLLMHGSSEDGKELNHKIGLRAGWLLGTSVTDRIARRKTASELYAKRSNVAHTGRLTGSFDHLKYDRFVGDLARAILERGGFPDWQALTFGG